MHNFESIIELKANIYSALLGFTVVHAFETRGNSIVSGAIEGWKVLKNICQENWNISCVSCTATTTTTT